MFFTPRKISPNFTSPNFIIGYGRIIDISASLNKIPTHDNNNKDMEALSYDWQMIGNDLYDSILMYKEQTDL